MVASQTRAASIVAGDTDWAVDLCDHSHGFTVSDVLNETNEPASNRRWVQRLLTEYSRSISVPVVFYGDATAALSPRTSGYAFAVLGELDSQQAFVGGAATWITVPRVAPQSGIVWLVLGESICTNGDFIAYVKQLVCLLYTSPSPRDS